MRLGNEPLAKLGQASPVMVEKGMHVSQSHSLAMEVIGLGAELGLPTSERCNPDVLGTKSAPLVRIGTPTSNQAAGT